MYEDNLFIGARVEVRGIDGFVTHLVRLKDGQNRVNVRLISGTTVIVHESKVALYF